MSKEELYLRALERGGARKLAEKILEEKAFDLFETNKKLELLNKELDKKILQQEVKLQSTEVRCKNAVEHVFDAILTLHTDGKIAPSENFFTWNLHNQNMITTIFCEKNA